MLRRALLLLTTGFLVLAAAPAAVATPTLVDNFPSAGGDYVRIFGDEVNADRLSVTVTSKAVVIRGKAKINTRRIAGAGACRKLGSRAVSCPSRQRVVLVYLPLYRGNDTVELRRKGAASRRIRVNFRGGAGNDRFVAKTPVESVPQRECLAGNEGNDTLSIPVQRRGSPTCRIEGGAGNDTLTGSSLSGGSGSDRLTGTPGNDTFDGGAGDDRLDGRAGRDSMEAGDGRDVLLGGSGDDGLEGDAGDDRLDGGDGNDVLFGSAGTDAFDAGAGNDRIFAADNDDDTTEDDARLRADFAAQGLLPPEAFICGDGTDTIGGHDRADVLIGCEAVDPFSDGTIAPTAVVGPDTVTLRGRCPEDRDPCTLQVSLRAAGPAASEAARTVYGTTAVGIPAGSQGVDVAVPLNAEGQRLLAGGPLAVLVDHEVAATADRSGRYGGFGLTLRR